MQNSLLNHLPLGKATLRQLATSVAIVMLASSLLPQPANAHKIDVEMLCRGSTLNPRCQSHRKLAKLASGSQALKPDTAEIIKLKLTDLAGVSEWIRVEIAGQKVTLLHTTVAASGVSRALTSLGLSPLPIAHTWYDHPTSRILFQPDACANSSAPTVTPAPSEACTITGTDTVLLPVGTNVHQGLFTLEYTENKMLRSVTFRVPVQKGVGS